MTGKPRRAATGAAVLRPRITATITATVLAELAEHGYARLSMEAVARRAGVGKSALYRRWPAKRDMVVAALSERAVPLAEIEDTGSLRGDLLATLRAILAWLTTPPMAAVLPDLVAEAGRDEALAEAMRTMIGEPRRARGAATLRRAVDRGELSPGTDIELALDLVAAPLYWHLKVRHAALEPDYLESLADHILRALGAVPSPGHDGPAQESALP
ncbi:TetR/AcrR family transcriptional regulator [Actinomadura roseirufa]|uniref:TetR/AcrR family transcriptional regulator n=1 Tax=Actinomadura roseirufa TaxID=2094049 RepID=UPI001041B528|nr:TetR/AcrR family transcriptional regulator [Actinomadura roseirufa]